MCAECSGLKFQANLKSNKKDERVCGYTKKMSMKYNFEAGRNGKMFWRNLETNLTSFTNFKN